MMIDYHKIADARQFYTACGFAEIEVPWIVSYEAYAVTCPADRQEFCTIGGYLNASGEQSFLDLMMAGRRLTRNCCITPCFRQEPVFDELHQRHFMKLELIDTDVSRDNLHAMIGVAQGFLNRYLPTRVVPTDVVGECFDIVDLKQGIELGSYGIRRQGDLSWIYGTGLALPRLDVVRAMNCKIDKNVI
jgi:hypothetical protein